MKYLRFVLLTVIAVGLVFTASCGLFKAKAKWTILAYYDGNCNLDTTKNGKSWVIAEAQELEKVGSTDKVQVFAMVGSLKTGGQCKYYHFEKHDNELPDQLSSTVIEDLGTKDMSDKRTLNDFIKAGRAKYPAENYMLMLKDHGGGWKGAMIDDQNGGHHMMTMPEMKEALDTFKFDIIAFDACLMSMLEVAYELKDNADYMVASQFVTFAGTYGGEEWLGKLTADPGMTALQLAKNVANASIATDIARQVNGHQAVTDLSKVAALAVKMGNLGNDLVTYTGQYGAEVLDAFMQTHSTELDDPAFCDIREFCIKLMEEPNLKDINILKEDCDALKTALNDAIPLTTTNATSVPRGGLCIHFPYRTDMFDSSNYVKLQFTATNWYAFLSKFIGSVGGSTTGNLQVNSNPTGAAIWINGTNTGQVTNVGFTNVNPGTYSVTLTLNGYNDWTDNNVQVTAGQTTTINATLTQGGGGAATVSGTAVWTGHGLSAYCRAYVDTIGGTIAYPIAVGAVNQGNGSFTVSVNLSAPLMVLVEVWDDLNNNNQYDPGVDGWGFWDRDGDQQWDTDDLVQLNPGGSVTGANVSLGFAPAPLNGTGIRSTINWQK
jgi:hypothetical protein